MAVQDKYVETRTAEDKLAKAAFSNGAELVTIIATEEIASADDDNSVYRLFKSVPSNYIPVQIDIACDAITGGTDYDLGLYKVGVGGAEVDKDVLMDGQDLSSALTRVSGDQLGLQSVGIDDVDKTLAELSGQANPDTSYDIVLTANTVGTASGTVSVIAKFVQG